jgi:hypothetical protein
MSATPILPAGGQSDGRSMADAYSVEQDQANLDETHILALWQTGLTHNGKPGEKLNWYYRQNVQGTPAVFFLKHADSGVPVGVAAIGKREMRFNGESILGGALVDFVTAVEHRTLFPALLLQKELLRRGLQSHQILYGLPNPKSLAVVRRAGYTLAGQMVRRARVLRSASYVARYLPGWLSLVVGPLIDRWRLLVLNAGRRDHVPYHVKWVNTLDTRFDSLWQNFALKDTLAGRRDSAFLNWRFARNPMRSHEFFVLTRADNDAAMGYVACEFQEQTLYVRDFLADSHTPGCLNSLLQRLVAAAFARGVSTVSIEFSGKPAIARTLEAAGFASRELRPLYAAVDAKQTSLLQEDAWYLTSADEDW